MKPNWANGRTHDQRSATLEPPDDAVNHWSCGIKQVTAGREFNKENVSGRNIQLTRAVGVTTSVYQIIRGWTVTI
jgi:hypothetical protein